MKHWLLISLLILIFQVYAEAQNAAHIVSEKTGNFSYETPELLGLWKVDKVTVGTEDVTPTAKWFSFEEDGSFTAGNGWLQNALGSYHYDNQQQTLLQSSEGKVDEFGAFNISFENGTMIWERMEEGQKVVVLLSKTLRKPLAPWDKIIGVWELIGMETLSKSTNTSVIADVETEWYFFRWDRRYNKFNASKKRVASNFWQIDAHSPWLTLLGDSNSKNEEWSIYFNEDQMYWERNEEDKVIKLIFNKGEL